EIGKEGDGGAGDADPGLGPIHENGLPDQEVCIEEVARGTNLAHSISNPESGVLAGGAIVAHHEKLILSQGEIDSIALAKQVPSAGIPQQRKYAPLGPWIIGHHRLSKTQVRLIFGCDVINVPQHLKLIDDQRGSLRTYAHGGEIAPVGFARLRDVFFAKAKEFNVVVGSRLGELHQLAIDPQQQLLIHVGKPQIVRPPATNLRIRLRPIAFHRGASFEFFNAKRGFTGGHIDSTNEMPSSFHKVEKQFARLAREIDVRFKDQIADPVNAVGGIDVLQRGSVGQAIENLPLDIGIVSIKVAD